MRQFIAIAKRHRLRLKKEVTIYPCKSCKNLYAHGDDTVKSHLVRYGFVMDYTVWKFHREA
jgi:RNase P subunit RPR2